MVQIWFSEFGRGNIGVGGKNKATLNRNNSYK